MPWAVLFVRIPQEEPDASARRGIVSGLWCRCERSRSGQATRETAPDDTRNCPPSCMEVRVEEVLRQAVSSQELPGGRAMQTPADVQAMLKLASLGFWGPRGSQPGWVAAATRRGARWTCVRGAPPASCRSGALSVRNAPRCGRCRARGPSHHSHVITIRGDSYRLRAKRKVGLFIHAAAAPDSAK